MDYRIDETDLANEYALHFEHQCELMKNNFERRRINFHPFQNRSQAADFIVGFIKDRGLNDIAFSDSVTLHQAGIYKAVESEFEKTRNIINPFKRTADGKYMVFADQPLGEKLDLPRDEYYKRMAKVVDGMRKTLISDVLIIGANAVTLSGEIVSIDSSGNRVAGMMFGPKHVIVVVGRNKICIDTESALQRIRNVAAPLNYIRHNMKHHNRYHELPCVMKGKCFDCSSPRSACRKIAIMRGEVEFNADRTHLVMVNEDLGL